MASSKSTGIDRYQSAVPGVAPGRGTYGYYTVDDLGTFGEAAANISHIYVQDQWSVGRLTLNLGLRIEDEKIPAFREKDVAIEFGWGEKIAPRIGAAYDMFGDGRMKLFGSYGRYYDWTKYELARGTFGGDVWKTYYRALDDPNVIPQRQSGQHARPRHSGRGVQASSIGAFRAFDDDVFDPNMKPMSQDSFSAGFEYQLRPTTVLAVNYIHNNLIRTIEDVGRLVDGSEVYTYGNPGEGILTNALLSTATTPFNIPKPKRQYDAVQVSLNRRFSGNWFLGGNYTLSRLYGNYAGIASSDEIRTPGYSSFAVDQQQGAQSFRPGGNANRGFDLDEMMWDAKGNLDPRGRLATDRPHVLKVYGAYMAPFGTQIGLNQYVGSGTPLTTDVRTLQTFVFVEGRGDMGRTPMLSTTDLLLSHEFASAGTRAHAIRAERAERLQPEDGSASIQCAEPQPQRSENQSGQPVNLANGYDYNALIAAYARRSGTNNAIDPRYGMHDLWSEGTQGHFMVKFLF